LCKCLNQASGKIASFRIVLALLSALVFAGCHALTPRVTYNLDHDARPDPTLQNQLERIDDAIRSSFNIPTAATSVALFDLKTGRYAPINATREEYAASVAKIGILLAYFELHPQAATNLNPQTKHELGLMIKASNNEMAAKFSEEMGLRQIQNVLNRHGFYDPARGGGIWVGKHYGKSGERIGDPIGNNSHAATTEQVLRFLLEMDQGQLLSKDASARMREIFASPEIPHDQIKFVKGLAGRNLTILRKWGSWEDWLHDSAIIEGPHRKYILVALTHHPRGDDYLEELARRIDDLMQTR
jgi:beta-lactamase class A